MMQNTANTPTDEAVITEIAGHIKSIISLLGENPERQGLQKTPMRAAKALHYVTRGYRQDLNTVINDALFDQEGSGMVIVRDVEFYSMCEHHILPFFGKISIGYIPRGKVIGLSKVARIVDVYARRLQLQERFTREVCDAIAGATGAEGVIAVCAAGHLCMKMRGVEKQDSTTVTIETTGSFDSDASLRQRFLTSLTL